MRKVFIDCGAWTGDSVLEFKKHYEDYDVFAFECHPKLKSSLTELSKKHKFNFINKAVWIKDGTMKLYLGVNDLTQSSTLFSKKKKYITTKNPSVVESVDFSKWMKNNIDINDYIVCKMNIEGAEYDVLEKMIKDKTINYVNKLYVAWHYNKIKDFPKKRHNKLYSTLQKLVDLSAWNYDEREAKNPY